MQKNVLTLFWHHSWEYRPYMLGILFLLPPTVLLHQFLPPLILAGMLTQLASGNFTHGDLWGSFGWPLLLFILLRVTSATVIWRLVIFLNWKLEASVTRDFYRRIFSHFIHQSTGFHADHFSGSLVAATSRLMSAYRLLLTSVVMQFIPLILSFIFVTIILLPRAPYYVLFLLVITIIYIVITVSGTRKVRRIGAEFAKAESAQLGELSDNLANIVAVKSFATTNEEVNRFDKVLDSTYKKFLEMTNVTQSRELAFSTITASITSVSIVLAFASVVLFRADIATTFLIIEYTGLLTARLWEFTTNTLRTYNRAIGDASDMVALLHKTPKVQDATVLEASRITKGALSFKRVYFTHADTKDAIYNNFSFEIKAGEKVGLVGRSGAGKTTFVKLLMRFSDIDSGVIAIDGQDITSISQDDLRRHIAYVPQEPRLFHRSIRENIAYGKPTASRAEIISAAKKARAHEFIMKLPHGYDSLVGEHGAKLSGGQRQRIAIARAILKDAPILVLDEATSALDSESETAIQASLTNLMQQRTTVVIAHRLSTIQKMDRIVVLDNGHVTEEGTHESLLREKGLYSKLWSYQSSEFLD